MNTKIEYLREQIISYRTLKKATGPFENRYVDSYAPKTGVTIAYHVKGDA